MYYMNLKKKAHFFFNLENIFYVRYLNCLQEKQEFLMLLRNNTIHFCYVLGVPQVTL
jgi:hypothetical protein